MFWIFWTFWILDKLVFLHKGDVLVGGVVGDKVCGDLQVLVTRYSVEDYGTVFDDVLYHIQTCFVYHFRLDKFPGGGEDDGMQHVGFYEGASFLLNVQYQDAGAVRIFHRALSL